MKIPGVTVFIHMLGPFPQAKVASSPWVTLAWAIKGHHGAIIASLASAWPGHATAAGQLTSQLCL